jgi:hypothetical protein
MVEPSRNYANETESYLRLPDPCDYAVAVDQAQREPVRLIITERVD